MMQKFLAALSTTTVIVMGVVGCTSNETQDTTTSSEPVIQKVFSDTKTIDGVALKYPEGTPELRLFRVELPVGSKIPLHTHPAPMMVYVQGENSGDLLVTQVMPDGTEVQREFKAGKAFIEGGDTPHFVQNQSDETTIIWVTVAGVKGMPTTNFVK